MLSYPGPALASQDILNKPVQESEDEKVLRILQEAGMLSEIGPYMKHLIETVPVNYEEVEVALARAGGPPLSEIVLAQRGAKE